MKLARRHFNRLMGASALCCQLPADLLASPSKAYDLRPKPVADGIWIIEGSRDYFNQTNGGAIVNCALLDSSDGMIVIDTGSSRKYGEALRDTVNQLDGRGLAASLNTHHHPDHFFGNQAFADRPIYALPQTRMAAERDGDGFSDNMYRLLGDWMRGTEVVPPTQDLNSSTIVIGDRTLRVLPLSGHTSADLAVIDVKTGMLIAGDLVFHDRAPTTPHANLDDWRQSLDSIEALAPAAILPGHGPVDSSGEAIRQTRSYLNWLETTLVDAANAGLDMVEIMETALPEQFAAMGAMPEEFHRSIAHLFPSIERSVLPLVNR